MAIEMRLMRDEREVATRMEDYDVDVTGDADARHPSDAMRGDGPDAGAVAELAAAYDRCAGRGAGAHGMTAVNAEGSPDMPWTPTFRLAMMVHKRLRSAVMSERRREQIASFTTEELRYMLVNGLSYPKTELGADDITRAAEASVWLAIAFEDVDKPRLLRLDPNSVTPRGVQDRFGIIVVPGVRESTCMALEETALILGPRMAEEPRFRYALRALTEALLSKGCGSSILMPGGMTVESAMRLVADDRDRLEADAAGIAATLLTDEPFLADDDMPYEIARQDMLHYIERARNARTDEERWPEPAPRRDGPDEAAAPAMNHEEGDTE